MALSISGIAPAIGDDMAGLSLDDLLKIEVEGASRYAQPLTETPSPVTVFSAEDIRRFGFRDLGEALSSSRGVHVTRDRSYSYLGVRGMGRPGDYNTRIVLLQDGARINDPLYDQAMIGLESPVDLDWIKRLEFVSGPSSASYGGNALFGIANAVLWSGADLAGSRLALEAGSGRLGRLGVMTGGVTETGLDWVTALSIYSHRGGDLYFQEFNQPGISDGVARGRDGERYVKGLLKASRDGWRATLNFSTRNKDVPTAYYGTLFNAPGNFVKDQFVHLDLGHSKVLSADLSQQLRFHVGHYVYRGEYPLPATLNRDTSRANWWSAEYQLLYTGLRDHRLMFGAEFLRGERLAQKNEDLTPYRVVLDDSRQTQKIGFYIQDEWRLAPGWLLNGGLRLDRQSEQPVMASPRLALIHQPSEQVTLKLLLGRAYRYPNQYERFYQDGEVSQKSNPDLKPERILTRELSADFMVAPTLKIGLGRYIHTIHDLIDQESDGAVSVFRNQAPLEARGWETDAEALLAGGWRVRGSISWMKVTQASGEPINSPRRLEKLLVDGPLPWAGWTLGLNLQSVSARNSLLARAPSHVTGNLVIRQRTLAKGGSWSFGIYNLADKRYWDPGGREHIQDLLPSDGRQWRLRWELGF